MACVWVLSVDSRGHGWEQAERRLPQEFQGEKVMLSPGEVKDTGISEQEALRPAPALIVTLGDCVPREAGWRVYRQTISQVSADRVERPGWHPAVES